MNETIERDAEVRALHERLMDGWNAGSAADFAAAWTESGSLVGFDGTHLRGRAEIERFHEPLFRTYLRGTRLVGDVQSVRWLAPGVALMHTTGGTIPRGKSRPSRERDSLQTLVAVEEDGQWRLAAFQNTRVRPIGRTFGGTLSWLISDWLWKIMGTKGNATR